MIAGILTSKEFPTQPRDRCRYCNAADCSRSCSSEPDESLIDLDEGKKVCRRCIRLAFDKVLGRG